jgi:hypothetical protein
MFTHNSSNNRSSNKRQGGPNNTGEKYIHALCVRRRISVKILETNAKNKPHNGPKN